MAREMTNIKVVDLDEIYNFIVNAFFIWNRLLSQIYVWISYILKYKFSNGSNELEWRNDKKKL